MSCQKRLQRCFTKLLQILSSIKRFLTLNLSPKVTCKTKYLNFLVTAGRKISCYYLMYKRNNGTIWYFVAVFFLKGNLGKFKIQFWLIKINLKTINRIILKLRMMRSWPISVKTQKVHKQNLDCFHGSRTTPLCDEVGWSAQWFGKSEKAKIRKLKLQYWGKWKP